MTASFHPCKELEASLACMKHCFTPPYLQGGKSQLVPEKVCLNPLGSLEAGETRLMFPKFRSCVLGRLPVLSGAAGGTSADFHSPCMLTVRCVQLQND